MKYIIILGDGMADEPIEELGNRTPLEVAHTPTFDYMASHSRMGLLKTVPQGYHPGSEVANMSVLGYDLPEKFMRFGNYIEFDMNRMSKKLSKLITKILKK